MTQFQSQLLVPLVSKAFAKILKCINGRVLLVENGEIVVVGGDLILRLAVDRDYMSLWLVELREKEGDRMFRLDLALARRANGAVKVQLSGVSLEDALADSAMWNALAIEKFGQDIISQPSEWIRQSYQEGVKGVLINESLRRSLRLALCGG